MPPPLILALLTHRVAQDTERQKVADVWQDDGWMFAQPTGKPTDPGADYGEWKEVLKITGVREAPSARRTAHGRDVPTRARVAQRAVIHLMGWSKIDMAQRYQHVPDELRRNIATQLGGLLWQGPDEGDGDGPTVALVPANGTTETETETRTRPGRDPFRETPWSEGSRLGDSNP